MKLVEYCRNALGSLSNTPLAEGDVVVLCQMAYMDLSNHIGWQLKDLAHLDAKQMQTIVGTAHADMYTQLVEALGDSARLGTVRIVAQHSILDKDTICQFSATIFDIDSALVVAYRGTDGTIVGWAEDLELLYKDQLSAHRPALDTLQQYAKGCTKPIIVAGHSKGGNLAVYAAARCNKRTQNKIQRVYNLDGPGFGSDLYASEGYKRLSDRLVKYVPEFCVFGNMLNDRQPYTVICADTNGIWQHYAFNWYISEDGVLQRSTSGLTKGSVLIRDTLEAMLPTVDKDTRILLVNTIYGAMQHAQVDTVGQMRDRENWKKLFQYIRRQPKDVQSTLWRLLGRLVKVSAQSGIHIAIGKPENP